jgi:transcriptional regulator with XRE-family HTH domain
MPTGPVRRPPQELAFAAAIRTARVEAGLTQTDVAEKAGLPAAHGAERRARAHAVPASARPLPSLRRSCGCSMSWWLCRPRRGSSHRRWAGHGVLIDPEPLLPTRWYRVLYHDAACGLARE